MEFIAALWAGLTHTFLESNVSPATKKLVCELIGTFVLVLTVILNVLQEKNEAAAMSQRWRCMYLKLTSKMNDPVASRLF